MIGAPDVLIVGGGVIGCAAAYTLAREGLSVVLLEEAELAGQASGAAAGMLAPVGEALGPPEHRPSDAFLRLGLASLELFPALCERVRELSGIDPEFEPSGILRLVLGEQAAVGLREQRAALASAGIAVEWVAADDLSRIQPGLAADVCGAIWSPGEAHVRSPLLSRALAGAAASLGADVRTGVAVRGLIRGRGRDGHRVSGVVTTEGELSAGAVVVCTGARAGSLSDWLDGAWRIPVEPVRGQICALEAPHPPLASIVWGPGAYLVPKRDGSVVVGATEEHVGFDRRVTAGGMQQLTAAACALVPGLVDAGFLRGWAGLRPGSPDGLPAVGPVPGFDGLWVAAGHYRNGVLLAPLTARVLLDGITGKTSPDAVALSPERWS